MAAIVEHAIGCVRSRLLAFPHVAAHCLTRLLLALRRHETPYAAPQQFVRRALQKRADGLVEARHPALEIRLLKRDGCALEKIAVPALALPQVPFARPQKDRG